MYLKKKKKLTWCLDWSATNESHWLNNFSACA
jgi:hypothetical protein